MGGILTADQDPIGTATSATSTSDLGGLNFLGDNASAYSDGQLSGVAAAGEIMPVFALDEEGGRVQRLKSLIGPVPSAREMAKTMTPDQVESLAERIANEMANLGFGMDLAPVLGVSSQPDDAVIGDRSFSDDPATVTEYAGAFINGLKAGGIFPVLKHFPGLGSATGNTDDAPASTPPLTQLEKSDIVPYETLLDQPGVGVMVANATVPGLTGDTPASLSPAAVKYLRGKLKFDGLIMTDSLSAGAITATHDLPSAALAALEAGIDVVLWDSTAETAAILDRLEAAVSDGTLSQDSIVASVGRMLDTKGLDACKIASAPVGATPSVTAAPQQSS